MNRKISTSLCSRKGATMAGAKGKRKYCCAECKKEQFLHWTALNRRTRPRCVDCGSYQLELVTQEAKKERDVGYRNVLEHDEHRGDIARGSS